MRNRTVLAGLVAALALAFVIGLATDAWANCLQRGKRWEDRSFWERVVSIAGVFDCL